MSRILFGRTILVAMLFGCAAEAQGPARSDGPALPTDDAWWKAGQATLADRLAVAQNRNRAKNVILFIGDGMGISTITATRIFDGQSRGQSGEENILPFERFSNVALVKTYNANSQVPDSAGTASAIMTGVKTNIGAINMSSRQMVGTCGDWRANIVPSLAERLDALGYATGVVTTTRLTHATPATVYAHSPHRNWESDADLPEGAKAEGCLDIASQLMDVSHGNGLEVAMGGGRSNFLPENVADPEYPDRTGRRKDGRDLTKEWVKSSNRAAYVTSAKDLATLDLAQTDRLLGLFEPSHMKYEADRARDAAGEPSLAAMTSVAIDMLSRNDKGYFLMVEGGRIDHAHHEGNAARALRDGQAFAEAVAAALAKVDLSETLILVTADHSHVFTIAGYPKRGNPILGVVHGAMDDADHPSHARDGKPYTTLGYWNGPGAIAGERPAVDNDEAQKLDYRQQAVVPTGSETHGGEDVALFATGASSWIVGGVLEQNALYHIMAYALGL